MKIIGLTGGIGSGKTTVLNMFQKLGAAVYIADIEAKVLMTTNSQLKEEITQLFGEKAYVNNNLNRSYIAAIVFKQQHKLKALNSIVHPKVKEHFKAFVQQSTANIIIYESAILFESESYKICDFIIAVTATMQNRIKRVMARDQITEIQILDRIKNQLQEKEIVNKAHFVIQNNTLNDTKLQVKTIFNLIEVSL
jgi:dephospho-CoA kinase